MQTKTKVLIGLCLLVFVIALKPFTDSVVGPCGNFLEEEPRECTLGLAITTYLVGAYLLTMCFSFFIFTLMLIEKELCRNEHNI